MIAKLHVLVRLLEHRKKLIASETIVSDRCWFEYEITFPDIYVSLLKPGFMFKFNDWYIEIGTLYPFVMNTDGCLEICMQYQDRIGNDAYNKTVKNFMNAGWEKIEKKYR